ncbi:MAG: FAD-dependent oxidoreductase [Candidatus Lokiarchaeota archaeon]|nr:FAD-dependent oxidoreductase [Candidatus Lokiarchaeota archaeon]
MTISESPKLNDKEERKLLKHSSEKVEVYNIIDQKYISPCANACPAGINIPGFLALIARGENLDAYKVMRRNNPLSSICGRVCPHPCEDQCRRAELDKENAVNICVLKSYAADKVMKSDGLNEDCLPSTRKSVGIIGAGPAGLTCAYFLRRLGHDVTMYESNPVPGGMATVGIPEYRLPMKVILWEIGLIEKLGVKILTNTTVGRDISFKEVQSKHEAVFLSTGLPKGNYIGIEGEHAIEVYQAVDFLKDLKLAIYNNTKLPEVGERVVVVGGGNVAVDAVRSAKRLGAKELTLVCLEQREEMPAWDHEIAACVDEDIGINNGWGPEAILTDKENHVRKIVFKQCTEVFDNSGRFSPQYCEDINIEYEADTIIMAIGQSPDVSYLKEIKGLNWFRKDRWLSVEPHTQKTSLSGVFAGGDLIKPGLMIEAIGHGRTAAQSIDMYLGGTGRLYTKDDVTIPLPPLDPRNWSTKRQYVDEIPERERDTTFKEVSLGLSDKSGQMETTRCIGCAIMQIDRDRCIGCGTCIKTCPIQAISFDINMIHYVFGDYKIRKAVVDTRLCECCGMCLSECPVNAISTINWSDELYFEEIAKFAGDGN